MSKIRMKEGEVYRCSNSACASEIQVTKPSVKAISDPRCSCGGEMKKPYTKPAFKLEQATPERLAQIFSKK